MKETFYFIWGLFIIAGVLVFGVCVLYFFLKLIVYAVTKLT